MAANHLNLSGETCQAFGFKWLRTIKPFNFTPPIHVKEAKLTGSMAARHLNLTAGEPVQLLGLNGYKPLVPPHPHFEEG